ncbi:MAG TPA: hypothetical protein VK436_15720 [Methanocella sp.]|nr:hypothetical protein [Methanocella sp.]
MGLLDSLLGRNHRQPPINIDEVYDVTIRDELEPRLLSHNTKLTNAIQDFLDHGDPERRLIFIFEEARKNEPDYHVPYYWCALCNMKRRNYPAAMTILSEGIEKCKVKSVLCRELAECHFCMEDLEKSIYWFCTSIMAGDQTDFNPYLFIGYMGDAWGMNDAAWWARRRARGISYTMSGAATEYIGSDRDRIMALASKKKTDQAVKMLETFYLHASRKLGNL